MGQFGRLTSIKQLPSKKTLVSYVKQAKQLNEAGIVVARKPVSARAALAKKASAKGLKVPAGLVAALESNRSALNTFGAFSPSARKEYIDWIAEAKADATREKRIEQAVAWMAEGKQRHWKYQK